MYIHWIYYHGNFSMYKIIELHFSLWIFLKTNPNGLNHVAMKIFHRTSYDVLTALNNEALQYYTRNAGIYIPEIQIVSELLRLYLWGSCPHENRDVLFLASVH